jgi:ACS family tartrate transporter-like MFS transporter
MSAAASAGEGLNADDKIIEASAIRKVVYRLVPIFLLCNFANYLDRTNVGFAALTMNRDMHFDATAFGIGAGIFSLGYFVFQIPSSIMTEKVGARLWVAVMMMTWGVISALNALIWSETSFYVVRFFLGAAEAGFAPAMIVYFSAWVPRPQRARMLALAGTASILSALIGSPLSGWLLDAFHGVSGIAGWRWLFAIESLPAIMMGIVVALFLGSQPEAASWLTPAERNWLARTMAAERTQREADGRHSLGQALAHPRVLLLAVTYFFMILSLAGTSMWMPQMIKQFGMTNTQVGWSLLVPNAIALLGLQLWTRHSDKTDERIWHIVTACVLVAFGVVLSANTASPAVALAGMTCIIMGSWSAIAIFWTQPTTFLTGIAAAGAIALINSVGNLSGFVGPYLIGMIRDHTGSFTGSLYGLAGSSLVAALFIAVLAVRDRRPQGVLQPMAKS